MTPEQLRKHLNGYEPCEDWFVEALSFWMSKDGSEVTKRIAERVIASNGDSI
jgi:hypothetical protein